VRVFGRIWRAQVWIGVATGVVAVAAFLTVLLLRDNGNAAEQQNAQTIYCLSPQQRSDFLEASANLKVGDPVPGESAQVLVGKRTLALRDWPTDRAAGDDFRRACAAFADATKGPAAAAPAGGGNTVVTFLLALLTALVPVGLTSWLGYRTAARKDADALRQSRTDALRTAALRFTQAAEAYLRLRASSADSGAELLATMHERRLELAAALAPVIAAVPGWERPRILRTRLESELRSDVVGRVGKIDQQLADRIRANVDGLTTEAEAVAAEYADVGAPPGKIAVPARNTQVTRRRDA
jgi:hypothetical protein